MTPNFGRRASDRKRGISQHTVVFHVDAHYLALTGEATYALRQLRDELLLDELYPKLCQVLNDIGEIDTRLRRRATRHVRTALRSRTETQNGRSLRTPENGKVEP